MANSNVPDAIATDATLEQTLCVIAEQREGVWQYFQDRTSEHDACTVFTKEDITLRALTNWHTMERSCDNLSSGGFSVSRTPALVNMETLPPVEGRDSTCITS